MHKNAKNRCLFEVRKLLTIVLFLEPQKILKILPPFLKIEMMTRSFKGLTDKQSQEKGSEKIIKLQKGFADFFGNYVLKNYHGVG